MNWGVIDAWAHRVRLRGPLLRFVCDHYEMWLGIHPSQIAPDYKRPPWWIRRALASDKSR